MIQERIDAWLAPFHRWQMAHFAHAGNRARWVSAAAALPLTAALAMTCYMADGRIYPVCQGRDYADYIYIAEEMTDEFTSAYFAHLGGDVRRERPVGGSLFQAGPSFENGELKKATMLALRDVLDRRFGPGAASVTWSRTRVPGSDAWISNCNALRRFAMVGGGG